MALFDISQIGSDDASVIELARSVLPLMLILLEKLLSDARLFLHLEVAGPVAVAYTVRFIVDQVDIASRVALYVKPRYRGIDVGGIRFRVDCRCPAAQRGRSALRPSRALRVLGKALRSRQRTAAGDFRGGGEPIYEPNRVRRPRSAEGALSRRVNASTAAASMTKRQMNIDDQRAIKVPSPLYSQYPYKQASIGQYG